MCGIVGIVESDLSRPVEPEELTRMVRMLHHRGPDEEGSVALPGVGLGMRRLSIVDLAGGQQPFNNETDTIQLVANGEIYNFADLRKDLEASGHTFRSRSDIEVLVHAYEEWGTDFLGRLRGMFAFAIWDRRQKRLLLVRDRLGIKPVYYYLGEDFIAFASEIKALLELPEIPREVEREALDLYLSLRYVPGPRTMFKNIFKLQPGHLLTFD
ncbi:MAG: asparagine synthetase B family protein, partial [Vicinamibacterales bacterium]